MYENKLRNHYLPHLTESDVGEFEREGLAASMFRGVVRLKYAGYNTHRYRGSEITSPTDSHRMWSVKGHKKSYRNLDLAKTAINNKLPFVERERYQLIEDDKNTRHAANQVGGGRKVLTLRIRDNVLSEKDWSVISVRLSSDSISSLECVADGVHLWEGLNIGGTLEDVAHWLSFDATGSHPEVMHEVRMGVDWATGVTLKKLKEFMLWGR